MSETKGVKETKKTSKTVKKTDVEEAVKTVKKTAKAVKENKLAEVMVTADGKKTGAKKTAAKTAVKKVAGETKTEKKTIAKKVVKKSEDKEATKEVKKTAKPKAKTVKKETVKEVKAEEVKAEEVKVEETKTEEVYEDLGPRRSIAFIGSECYPFVKTGGLSIWIYVLMDVSSMSVSWNMPLMVLSMISSIMKNSSQPAIHISVWLMIFRSSVCSLKLLYRLYCIWTGSLISSIAMTGRLL